MIKLLLAFNCFAGYSTATIQLRGVVPRIVNKYVVADKVIVEHNFPIVMPDYCKRLSETKIECTQDLTIEVVE